MNICLSHIEDIEQFRSTKSTIQIIIQPKISRQSQFREFNNSINSDTDNLRD